MLRLPFCLAVLMLPTLALAEEVDNPEYAYWSKFKPGSTVSHDMASKSPEGSATAHMTRKLVSVDADKVVLEVHATVKMEGQEIKSPVQKQEITAKIDEGKVDPAYKAMQAPDVQKGNETLTINGKKVKCTWYKIKAEDSDTANVKAWFSDTVPGGMVNMDYKSAGSSMTARIKSFKAE